MKMKKMTLASLGLLSFSVLQLVGPTVLAAEEEAWHSPVKGTTNATVLFGTEEDGSTGPVSPVEPEGNIEEPDEGTDVGTGDGTAKFNIMASNFRFNETELTFDPTGNVTEKIAKPIGLDANGMNLWAFGTYLKVNDGEETMVLENVPNFVQVWDHRGKNNGWNVTVSMGEFKGKDASGTEHTLNGATLSLNDGSLKGPDMDLAPDFESFLKARPSEAWASVLPEKTFIINDEPQTLMSADANKGTGNWSLRFGEIAEPTADVKNQTLVQGSGVNLNIPAKALPQAEVEYSAELTWTLTEGPAA